MLLPILNRNPLLFTFHGHINPISNGAVFALTQNNSTSLFPFFFSSSSSSTSLQQETPKTKEDPIFDFFRSSQLVKVICYNPKLLASSLHKRIQPNLRLLESTFGSATYVIKAIIRVPWLLTVNLEKHVIPNLKILREMSIPTDKIICLFTRYPLVLVKDPSVIIETDTLSAFARLPTCMLLSEDKITKTFKFFKEKLEWDSALVLRRLILLTLSVEGRIIPRCAVLNVLAKNGLWNGKPTICTLLGMIEEKFREKFVDKHGKEVPQVIDAYQGKVDFVGFESTIVKF